MTNKGQEGQEGQEGQRMLPLRRRDEWARPGALFLVPHHCLQRDSWAD